MRVDWSERLVELQALLDQGLTCREIGEHFGIKTSSVRSLLCRLRKKNVLAPSLDTEYEDEAPPGQTPSPDHPTTLQIEVTDKKQVTFDVLDFIQHKIREQEILQNKSSSQKEVSIRLRTHIPFAIGFSADWHLGGAGVDYTTFLKHLQLFIETPNLFMGIIGDLIDNFIKGRIKGAMMHALFGPQEQYDTIKELFRLLGRKILFYTAGNHDDWTDSESGIDILSLLSQTLAEVPYLRNGGGINLDVNSGAVSYRLFAKHKYRFNSSFNATHTTKRMYEFESPYDIGVTAHTHNPSVEHTKRWTGPQMRDIIYLVCGTYKVEDPFAAANGYGQTSRISVPTVIFFPDEKRMIPFYRLEDAVPILKFLTETYLARQTPQS